LDARYLVHNWPVRFFFDEERDITRLYREIVAEGMYWVATRFGRDMTVLDIGANIGVFTAFIYPYASRIFAVEPATVNYDNLIQMIGHNALENVFTQQCALSGKTEVRMLDAETDKEKGAGDCLGYTIMAENGTEPVQCFSLAQFMNANEIGCVDLMKVDVEGAEEEIFSAPDFLSVAPKIKRILGEAHFGRTVSPYLREAGYKVGRLEGQGNLFLAVRE